MKIFITGATGIIGSNLIRKLLQKQHQITIITRDKKNVKSEFKDLITVVEGDPKEYDTIASNIQDQDVIINLAGQNIITKRWSEKQKQRLYDSRVLPNQNIVKAIEQYNLQPKVVITPSGIDYYPYHKTTVYTEEAEPKEDFVGQLCVDWERDILSLNEKGIRGVAFRFGVGFSKTGKLTERMFLPHKLFFGGWVGSGKQWLPILHLEDFVGVIIWAIENPNGKGAYNVTINEHHTFKQIAKIGGKVMGRWTWTWVPGFVLKIILGKRSDLLLNGRKVSPQKLLDAGYKFKFLSAQSVLEDVL